MTVDPGQVRRASRMRTALWEFASSMLGDMAVDRGGPEDQAYRELSEQMEDIIERHATLVLTLQDGSLVSGLTLSRMPDDFDSRARAFMAFREVLNGHLSRLAGDVAADPLSAARHMLTMDSAFDRVSNLLDDVLRADADTAGPAPQPSDDCSICLESIGDRAAVSCASCNRRLHEACLTGYRISCAEASVRCPTCRDSFD